MTGTKTAAVMAAMLLALPAAAQESGLPGGATALNERHGDWTVSCSVAEGRKDCGFTQSVGNSQTGQSLMAIELQAPQANAAEGMLVTAFGLRLDAGIELGVDGAPLIPAQPFLTCVQTGCVVPIRFDEVALTSLKLGKQLEINAVNVQNGEKITVPISLAGFSAAYNRAAELTK